MRRIFIAASLLLLLPVTAYAAPAASGVASDIVLSTLQQTIAGWNSPAATIGLDLFGGLFVITFVLATGYSIMQEQGINPLAIGALLIRQVVFAGFWIWLLQNWAGSFGSAIIRSFQQAGQTMGGVYADPASVISQGANIAAQLFNQTSIVHPGTAIGLCICAVLIFMCFLFAAFLMMLALAKALIAVGIGGIAMGFAGFPETRHLAYNAVFMTVAAGARLMMIQLLAGMASTILQGLAGSGPLGQDDVWPILAVAFIWACLAFSLPSMAEHMFGGSGHGRAGPGQLWAATGGAVSGVISAASGVGSVGTSIAGAGRSMMASLAGSGSGSGSGGGSGTSGGSGRLPSGASSTGTGVTAAAGTRMRASGARYTPKGP